MIAPKNILFISYDGMTDPLGQSQVIPYLIGLTKYGYRFTILSCDKKNKYKAHHQHIKDILKPYPIRWVPIRYHKNPPVLSSVYDVMALKRKARQLHSKEKFDLVHTRAGTPAIVGLWMKNKLGVKFLNDIRDFFADSRIDSGSWNKRNPIYLKIYQYFKRKEENAIKNNDGIVCLTYKAQDIIKQSPQYNKQTPLEVIPCCVDLNLFNPDKIDLELKRKFAQELGLQNDDFILSYLGSIGGWYLTDEMMKFYKIISGNIPKAKFLFISPHQHEIIYNLAEKFGIPKNKICVKYAQRHEVPVLLSFSNYSVFFIQPCFSKQASSPTKQAEIMAMGIPVITNKGVGDVAAIVSKYHSGHVLGDLCENEYLNIATILSKENTFDKTRIRKGAYDYFNLANGVEKYHSIYNSILK